MSEVICFKNNRSLLVDFFSIFIKNFLMSIIFKDFIEFVTVLLLGFLIFLGGGGDKTCGILAPRSRIKPAQHPLHWVSTSRTIQNYIKIESYSWDEERPVL